MPRNILVLYVRTFVMSLLFFMPTWYAFEHQFGSNSQINLIYAVTLGLSVILQIPTGALADIYGRKLAVVVGSILDGLGFVIISFTHNLNGLWAGYLVNSVGAALVSGSEDALIYDTLKDCGREKDFAKVQSQTGLIWRVGMIIASLFGGYLANISLSLPYLLVGLTSIVGGLLALLFTEPKFSNEGITLKKYLAETRIGIHELFKSTRQTYFSLYYMIIGGFSFYFVYFFYLPYADFYKFTNDEKSCIFPIIFITVAVATYFLSQKIDLFNRSKIFMFIPFILVIGYIAGYFVPIFLVPVVIATVWIVSSIRFSILNQFANDEYSSRHRATAISTLAMGADIVLIVITLILYPFIDSIYPPLLMIDLGFAALIVLIPITFLLYDAESKHLKL